MGSETGASLTAAEEDMLRSWKRLVRVADRFVRDFGMDKELADAAWQWVADSARALHEKAAKPPDTEKAHG